jgi:flagellar hook protein FlgE
MSLFNTLAVGASGLGASSTNLSVIGDNVANIGTTGYKSSRASFGDMMPEVCGGITGPTVRGLGTRLLGIDTSFTQGTLTDTGNALDTAISGPGFFQVSSGGQYFYTRDGSFRVDKDHYIVSPNGLRLQGYGVQDNKVISTLDDIRLNLNPIDHKTTENITIDAVLAADADFSTTPYTAAVKDGTAAGSSFADLSTTADYSTSSTIYDSMGVAHDVTLFFERVGPNDWNWSGVVDGGDVDFSGDGVPDGDAGYAFEIASGTMSFDANGKLAAFTETPTATTWNWPGATQFTFNLNVGLDAAGNSVEGMVRMTGSSSAITSIDQDGYRSANLVSLRIRQDGCIMSTYENGEELVLAKIALALFPSEGGLQRVGGNLYEETGRSGAAALGSPGEGGRGVTTGYALESSNVELEDQFVEMIQAQRSYQANTGVIRTANETLQQLVNLV